MRIPDYLYGRLDVRSKLFSKPLYLNSEIPVPLGILGSVCLSRHSEDFKKDHALHERPCSRSPRMAPSTGLTCSGFYKGCFGAHKRFTGFTELKLVITKGYIYIYIRIGAIEVVQGSHGVAS